MTPERLKELRANTTELGITADDGHIMCDGETWLGVLTLAERHLCLIGADRIVLQTEISRETIDAAIDAAMKGGD